MTHTPGPWWYDEHTECIGSPAGWICSLHYYGERKSDVPFGGQTNDARLIAAAPDLLQACKVALDALGCDRIRQDRLEAQRIIHAAVRKAEGKLQ